MEFNTGKPPAGEVGMCVTDAVNNSSWQYWSGDHFCCYECDPRDAWLERRNASSVQAPRWRFATLAEITAAGIPESEARGMVHRSQLPDAEWGPWIEWNGGECPIPEAKAGEFEVRTDDVDQVRASMYCRNEPAGVGWMSNCWAQHKNHWPILAYRVKRSAETCTPPDTQAPDEPEDEAAMNAAMIERDLREPAEKPQAAAVAVAEPTPWHLRCAPWTNRFGGWGA